MILIIGKILSALLLLTCIASVWLYKYKKISKLESVAIYSTFIILLVGFGCCVGLIIC